MALSPKSPRINEARARQIAQNEVTFRDVNERVEEAAQGSFDQPDKDEIGFLCECGAPDCTETLLLTQDKYTDVRSNGARFVVLPGHEIPGAEEVVERQPRFFVVEKFGSAKEDALAADPRS